MKPRECEDFDQGEYNGQFTIFPFGEFHGDESLEVYCYFDPRGSVPYQAAQTYLNVDPGTPSEL